MLINKGHAFVIIEQFENALVEYDLVIDFLEQKLKKQSDIEGPGERETLLDSYLGRNKKSVFFLCLYILKAKRMLMLS